MLHIKSNLHIWYVPTRKKMQFHFSTLLNEPEESQNFLPSMISVETVLRPEKTWLFYKEPSECCLHHWHSQSMSPRRKIYSKTCDECSCGSGSTGPMQWTFTKFSAHFHSWVISNLVSLRTVPKWGIRTCSSDYLKDKSPFGAHCLPSLPHATCVNEIMTERAPLGWDCWVETCCKTLES